MDVRSVVLCRGDYRIFEQIEVIGAPQSASFAARAVLDDGREFPVKLFRLEHESTSDKQAYVSVSPTFLNGKGRVNLHEVQPNGALSDACCSYELNFAQAKWKSRINGKIKKGLCERIRNFDKDRIHQHIEIGIKQVIPAANEQVVRVAVRTPSDYNANLQVVCFSEAFNTTFEGVPMGRVTRSSRITNEPKVIERTFSVRVPANIGPLFLWVQDSDHPAYTTFELLDQNRLRELLEHQQWLFNDAQHDPYYETWLRQHQVSPTELSEQRAMHFEDEPLFSIIVPLYQTPELLFQEMIASVMAQSYAHWELILVNASPKDAILSRLVSEASAADDRIQIQILDENKGISENTNAGLDIAQGDFVCFFDHDDTLEPDALYEYARAIYLHPDTDMLYCDEDILFADGHHGDPYFKPDFEIDLLRASNYVCHLLCIRRTLLDNLPRYTKEFDGAQDHFLTLAASEHARRITHVPRMLYHWRASETSVVSGEDNKSYAAQAGIRAVKAHLNRLGIEADVSLGRWPFTYNVRYAPPHPAPLVSIIIPTSDQADMLKRCVLSILEKTTYTNYEIILVDNNSVEDATFATYQKLINESTGRVRAITYDKPFNFSALCNYGATKANGDYLCFLNNDMELITEDWLEQLVGITTRGEVGVVGCRLMYPDGCIQHAGVVIAGEAANHLHKDRSDGDDGYFHLGGLPQNPSAVTGACMMMRRNVFEQMGGFDEELSVTYSDVDLCLRMREAGLLVVYTPEVRLIHYESISRGFDEDSVGRERYLKEVATMQQRWTRYYVTGDPFMHPELCREDPLNRYYHF